MKTLKKKWWLILISAFALLIIVPKVLLGTFIVAYASIGLLCQICIWGGLLIGLLGFCIDGVLKNVCAIKNTGEAPTVLAIIIILLAIYNYPIFFLNLLK